MTTGSAMPPMLKVRAAPQPQPAKRADEERCSVCFNPKVGDCATCGMPSCKGHFDASTKRRSKCTQRKSLPAEQEKWDEQWQRHSADNDFRAQQQKLLDECSADKSSAQRVKEQAKEQIRISSRRSDDNFRGKDEALAPAAASERDVMKPKAIIIESFPYGETEQGKLPRSSSFDILLLSQETPVRSVMRPHYAFPGPAIEGPAKPGTSEHGIPIKMKLTGTNEGKDSVNYHPFSKGGPVRPPAAK
eukprot:5782559-Pyramimonas_sp.AAC.1